MRQGMLLARSEQLRGQIGQYAQPLKAPLARIDQARWLVAQGWAWLRANPAAPAAVVVGVAVVRPRRALRWAFRWGRRAWFGWSLYKRLQANGVVSAFSTAARLTRR